MFIYFPPKENSIGGHVIMKYSRANGDMDGKPEKSEQGTNEREPHLLWIEEYQVLLPLVTGTVVLGL